MAGTGLPARTRYRAAVSTPDGVIVYSTDDADELVAVERRHAAAGNPLAIGEWDRSAEIYVGLGAAA